MAARLRFVRTERRAETIDSAERRGRRLAVELSRLREICIAFIEVFSCEQPTPLANRCCEDRSVNEKEIPIVKKIANTLLYFVTHTGDRALALASQPQVTIVEKKIDAVLFRLDRIINGARTSNYQVADGQFVPARSTGIRPYLSGHLDRRFLGELREPFPRLGCKTNFH